MDKNIRVVNILKNVLGDEVVLQPSLRRENIAKWDSMKHLEIIFAIEDEFNVTVGSDSFLELDSVEAIVHFLDLKNEA